MAVCTIANQSSRKLAMGATEMISAALCEISGLGGAFQINTYTTGGQETPRVTVDGAGTYTVVWDCNGSDSIRARQISAAGVPLGQDFVVSSASAPGPRGYPSVAASDEGSFVVVWGDNGVVGDPDQSIQGRRFHSDATPVTGQFRANLVQTQYSQERPDVSVNPINGDFVVTWESTEAGFSNDDIRIGFFDSTGSDLAEFVVNSYTSGFQQWPSIDMEPNGHVAVAWAGPTTGDSEGITFRRFSSIGSLISDVLVNSHTTGRQDEPDVDMSLDGTAFVSWHSPGSQGDTDQEGVVGAQADNLSATGSDIQVNTTTVGSQINARSAWDQRSRRVTVWESNDTIRARLFDNSDELPAGIGFFASMWGLRNLGTWDDYRVTVPLGTRQMIVTIEDLNPSPPNDVDLYLRHLVRPEATTFDCRSNVGGAGQETCTIDHPAPGRWWVSAANWNVGHLPYRIRVTQTLDSGVIFTDGFESGDTSAW